MKIEAHQLIEDLIQRCQLAITAIEGYQPMSDAELNWKASPDRWSILECMEHINRYGRFYLPEMKQRMEAGKNIASSATFKSGWLGNYFALSMLPKEKLNTMNTFKSMNPAGSAVPREALTELLTQLKQLIELLNTARDKNLSKIKTSITISKWIKLRLGDTFRVVIYHIQRHLVQMEKIEAGYKASK